MTDGFDVLVQEVIEAIATIPLEIEVASPRTITSIATRELA